MNKEYAALIQQTLSKVAIKHDHRSKMYWNLRGAGMSNIEAEQFLDQRPHYWKIQ